MKRLLIGLAFAVLLAVPAIAQSRVVMTIDAVNVSGGYVNGWAFDCASGMTPPEVSVGFWSLDQGGWFFPPRVDVIEQVPRPDVQAMFSPWCPALTGTTGFWLYPTWPPPGHWRLYVNWSASDGAMAYDTRDVTIPPV